MVVNNLHFTPTGMASTSSIDAMATLKAYESTAPSAEEIRVYLSRDPEYRRLDELQQKGWSNPAGDQFFAARRQKSDNTSKADQRGLLGMMINVGRDLQGGHNVMINFGPRDERVKVRFMDITMFAEEFGSPTDRKHHLDWTSLRQKWPYHTPHYDLVICDGVPMRGQNLDDNAISVQPMRLTCAELYLGLKKIRCGGTLIVLLHRINNVRTFRIIKMLHGFSSVQVFKPTKSHAIRSSFYLVAKNVQSDSSACLRAMNLFKTVWEYATFENTSQETFRLCTELTLKEQSLSTELEEFGPWYTELAQPVWRTQADALAVASFTQDHDAIS
ncbi:NAD(P)-binding protein [Aureobasidium pullulans]|nr:NAD(P)-binding protein [Aureobasidium pullulans]